MTSSPRDPANQCGSIIQVDKLSVGEQIAVPGTSEVLTYMSSRVPGRTAEYSFTLPLVDGTLDPAIDHFMVEVEIAGQVHITTLSPSTYLNYMFTWDGKDNSGNPLMSSAMATISKHTYYNTGTYPDIPEVHTQLLGSFMAQPLGLGGMTLSSVHYYDPLAKIIHYGDGTYEDRDIMQVTVDGSGNVQDVTGSSTFDSYMIVNRAAKEAYLFDSTGRHRQTRSSRSGALLKTINYDGSGRLSSIVDSFGQTISITRPTGSSVVITAPHSQTTTLGLTSGWVTSVTDPVSNVHTLSFGTGGLLSTYSPPNGGITTMTYDGDGLLSQDSHSSGASWTFSRATSFTGAAGVGTTTITASTNLGLTTNYVISYDASGSTTRNANEPSGNAVAFNYEPAYNSQMSNGLGYHTNAYYTSDARFGTMAPYSNNWSRSIGSSGLSATVSMSDTFSSASLLMLTAETETTTINSHNWTRAYSLSTGIETYTSPLGRSVGVKYNSANQVTQMTIPSNAAVTLAYDASGRLSSATQGSRVTSYTYDTAGNLNTITDPLSQVTTFGYDSNGRVTSKTFPDLRIVNFGYDGNGNLISVQIPASVTHTQTFSLYDLIASYVAPMLGSTLYTTSYTYDNDKRITQVTHPDSTTLQFTYDATYGTPSTLVAPEGTYNYTFDSSGRMSSVVSPASITNSFGYDGANVTSFGTSWSTYTPQVTHTYANLLQTNTTFVPTSGSSTSVNFTYNNDFLMTAAGNLSLTRTASTGLVSLSTLTNVTEGFSWDTTYGEVSQYQAKYSGSEFFKQVYTRDYLGRITQIAETVGGTTTKNYGYSYDTSGRLSTVSIGGTPTRTYSYDNNSNRSSVVGVGTTSATYDDQDRILTYGTYTYTHNMRGERTAKSDSASVEAFTYAYNGLGALTTMTHTYAGGTGTITDTYNYTNDALGNRIEVKKGTTLQNRYLYDEQGRLIAELNSSGNFLSLFIYATMAHAPDYMIKSGTKYKIIHDQLGSVRRVVNASTGAIASSIDYDEFGKVISSSTLNFQPFGFAAGLRDDVTGFVRFGLRVYDPETGRWLSKDPLLFDGGDYNLYGYGEGDPVNRLDPSGTTWTGIFSGAIGGAFGGACAGYAKWRVPGIIPGLVWGGFGGAMLGHRLSGGWSGNFSDSVMGGICPPPLPPPPGGPGGSGGTGGTGANGGGGAGAGGSGGAGGAPMCSAGSST